MFPFPGTLNLLFLLITEHSQSTALRVVEGMAAQTAGLLSIDQQIHSGNHGR
jgi:hypothetical protein